jgi:hypothetical protein
MSVPLLLFVIAVVPVAIFWELCKINSRLTSTFPTLLETSDGPNFKMRGQAHDPVAGKALDGRRRSGYC